MLLQMVQAKKCSCWAGLAELFLSRLCTYVTKNLFLEWLLRQYLQYVCVRSFAFGIGCPHFAQICAQI